MSGSAYRAEYLAEMAAEAETKAEADQYWKEYRNEMIAVTGDKNLFRKPPCYTNKPSKSLRRTLSRCSCGATSIGWTRKEFGYPECSCGWKSAKGTGELGYLECSCSCGKLNGKHRVGPWVKFRCQCGKETDWHSRNSNARNEWNNIQEEQPCTKTHTEI